MFPHYGKPCKVGVISKGVHFSELYVQEKVALKKRNQQKTAWVLRVIWNLLNLGFLVFTGDASK